MKRFLGLGLIIALLMTGCSANEEDQQLIKEISERLEEIEDNNKKLNDKINSLTEENQRLRGENKVLIAQLSATPMPKPTITSLPIITPTPILASESTSTPAPTAMGQPTEFEGVTIIPHTGTVVSTTSVNIRSGPGTIYSKVGSVKTGEEFVISGETSNGWWQIEYDGDTAYINQKYSMLKEPTLTFDQLKSRHVFESNPGTIYKRAQCEIEKPENIVVESFVSRDGKTEYYIYYFNNNTDRYCTDSYSAKMSYYDAQGYEMPQSSRSISFEMLGYAAYYIDNDFGWSSRKLLIKHEHENQDIRQFKKINLLSSTYSNGFVEIKLKNPNDTGLSIVSMVVLFFDNEGYYIGRLGTRTSNLYASQYEDVIQVEAPSEMKSYIIIFTDNDLL